jgi:hypothetical protein
LNRDIHISEASGNRTFTLDWLDEAALPTWSYSIVPQPLNIGVDLATYTRVGTRKVRMNWAYGSIAPTVEYEDEAGTP